jgi:hypothetical protein
MCATFSEVFTTDVPFYKDPMSITVDYYAGLAGNNAFLMGMLTNSDRKRGDEIMRNQTKFRTC